MGKQAFLFSLLVEYFGQSEQSIETEIVENIKKKVSILLSEISTKINNTKRRRSNIAPKARKVSNILEQINELIKKAEDESANSIEGIRLINWLTKLLTSLEEGATVTAQEDSDIRLCFEKISNLELRAAGLSDTTIDRLKKSKIEWKKDKIENLYTYWFEPLYKQENDFIKDFDLFLDTKLATNEAEIIYDIKDFLKDQDKNIDCNCFWQLFRRMKIAGGETRNTVAGGEIWDTMETDQRSEYIVTEIKKAFNNNNPESVGLGEEELQKIISILAEQLLNDLSAYCKQGKNYTTVRRENFRALIRYRLCNKLYYYSDEGPAYKMLAFRIFQEEFPGNICIHPAATLGSRVFISNHVMIGKQCHIYDDTYLKDRVCLFPFKSHEKETEGSYIVIGEGCILDKYTKVIGIVEIGNRCYINYDGIISKNIGELSKVGSQYDICKMEEKEYSEILNQVKGEIYE